MELPNAGGLFPNADVTYRGVSVGRVGTMGLTATGIVVDLNISNSAPKIPSSGLQATVADLSAVGEEYVNLRPQTSQGPYLAAESVIPERDTQVPPPITSLLTSINTLVTSVPQQSLRTLVAELGNAFQGQGPNLQVLLDNSSTLTHAATEDIPQTSKLIGDGQTVLATQAADTAAIQSFGRNAALLASQLASSDSDLRRLIINTPQAALQVTGLLRDNDVEPQRGDRQPAHHLGRDADPAARAGGDAVRAAGRGRGGLHGDQLSRSQLRGRADVLQPAALHRGIRRHRVPQRAGHSRRHRR